MRPYDVEFFAPNLRFRGNTIINNFTFKEDYLSPETNEITILPVEGVAKYDIVRIAGNGRDVSGVVSEVERANDGLVKISYKSLITLFDTEMVFPVDDQRKGTLEDFLKKILTQYFIENTDTIQNITGLEIQTVTATPDWYFHITPSHKGGHYNALGLLKSVIIPAFNKYRVTLSCSFDPGTGKIIVKIGKATGTPQIIEADLPNVVDKTITIRQSNVEQNKLIIYDAANDYSESRTYYLHPDLSYNQKNEDRISPVVCRVRVVDSSQESTFNSLAINTASDVFANVRYNNLIELECLPDDALIDPIKMELGKEVDVISGGNSYRTMLTGRTIGDTVKLTFGVVRLDLTKIIEQSVKEELQTSNAPASSGGSGAKGEDGFSPTITTQETADDVTLTITNKDGKETVTIPKGGGTQVSFSDLTPEQKASLKGDKGDKGDKGEKGDKGDKGDSGANGADGSKISMITSTILSSGWNNKVYSFETQYPAANYDIEIAPDGDSITTGQIEAWSAAQIIGSGTANQLKAIGTQPGIDIPVIVKVVTK